MKYQSFVLFSGTLIALSACSSTNTSVPPSSSWLKPNIRLFIGLNHGGVVENKDMGEIKNAPTDAVTSATQGGAHVGSHLLFPLGRNKLETGADLVLNEQSLTYDDEIHGYKGERTIRLAQIMVPITCNFGFFRRSNPDGVLCLKLGVAGLFTLFDISDGDASLPKYDSKPFAGGLTLGVDYMPFTLKNGAGLGFYGDFYRGSRIYEDMYNESGFQEKGTSLAKIGMMYQF